MDVQQLARIAMSIRYKDWRFKIGHLGNGYSVQCIFFDGPEEQKGRKWYISPHSTESEVVQTFLKAVLAAEEHEAREKFLFQDVAIFGPHKLVWDLLDVRHDSRNDVLPVITEKVDEE